MAGASIVRLLQLVRFVRVGLAARTIQDYLWNQPGKRAGNHADPEPYEAWLSQLEKRISKMRQIQPSKSWQVEARKRLLQVAALAVAMMEAIDNGVTPEYCDECGAQPSHCACGLGK